ASCPDYSAYSQQRHIPLSSGRYALSWQRPAPACRTFNSSVVEAAITHITADIADPDLARLFENSYPNTLDTAVRWRGRAADNNEELAFIITGDIDAMWLRDSANQLMSYLPLLGPSSSPSNSSGGDLASLYRGVINLQARHVLTAPFCNSFQAPRESGIAAATNSAAASDVVVPPYDAAAVFECKYELDSLAAFLQLSAAYLSATGDRGFFARAASQWAAAARAALATARAMRDAPTYDDGDGHVVKSPYTFTRQTTRATETLANDGAGSPVGNGTGLVRSAFRPSDDSTLFQLLVPANMMFARGLARAAGVADAAGDGALAAEMRNFAAELGAAVEQHGVVRVPVLRGAGTGGTETVYAYEVDGFGSAAIMDDANIPSLLAAPLLGYVNATDALYRRTRARTLAPPAAGGNPYFMQGPVLSAVGGPHVGPGMAWPMALIVQIMTSDDDAEVTAALGQILRSTDGLGLIHESVNTFNASQWTRQWFSWANGLFGQMILDLHSRKPGILKTSFQ
ncbi:duf1237 domain-containing protein, partial [Lasiosphaeria miniovina]